MVLLCRLLVYKCARENTKGMNASKPLMIALRFCTSSRMYSVGCLD